MCTVVDAVEMFYSHIEAYASGSYMRHNGDSMQRLNIELVMCGQKKVTKLNVRLMIPANGEKKRTVANRQ